jgi:hypothetical protein
MLTLLTALALQTTAQAQETEAPPSHVVIEEEPLEAGPAELGLGVILGAPTGLSLGYRPSSQSHIVNVGLAWNIPQQRVHAHLDYLRTVYVLNDPNGPDLTFPVNVGVGARFQSWDGSGNQAGIGVRLPLQLTMVPKYHPFDVFLELVPVLLLYPETKARLDGALGARYFFG